jgi:RNA polymerase sigma-70 factor, ECF subfamily
MTRAEEFQELRPLLFAIAYRILGSVAEAEDAVQDTWLRYAASPVQPASVKAFLSTVVTRISIDVLRSARVRREEYPGPWFPEPLLTDPYEDPERSAELADSVSIAALLLLERLSPPERAVFVLRDVFGFGFPEIASAVGRSEPACRQLAVRARRHMDAGRPRFEADRRERAELAARFFGAVRDGDVESLRELLAADVSLVGDAGGKAPQLARSIIGAEKVARILVALMRVGPAYAVAPGTAGGLWLTSYPPDADPHTAAGTAREVSVAGAQVGPQVRLPAGYLIERATADGLLLAPVAPQPTATAYRLWDPAAPKTSRKMFYLYCPFCRFRCGHPASDYDLGLPAARGAGRNPGD